MAASGRSWWAGAVLGAFGVPWRGASAAARCVLTAPGEIVLMHVGSHPTDHSTLDANALPRVISGLRAAGYGFVTLDALVP